MNSALVLNELLNMKYSGNKVIKAKMISTACLITLPGICFKMLISKRGPFETRERLELLETGLLFNVTFHSSAITCL